MKSLNLKIIFGIAVFLIIPTLIHGQVSSPQASVRSFYKWYVHSLNRGGNPIENKTGLQKYVTARLVGRIAKALKSEDGIDADYFLSAQDFDEDWERNITVSTPVIKGETARLTVTLTGRHIRKDKLSVFMKRETGAWKIDKVNDWDL
jgi:hypothetical protein